MAPFRNYITNCGNLEWRWEFDFFKTFLSATKTKKGIVTFSKLLKQKSKLPFGF